MKKIVSLLLSMAFACAVQEKSARPNFSPVYRLHVADKIHSGIGYIQMGK